MYNQQFLHAPNTFANSHCLYPFADPVVNQGQMKVIALSNQTSITQVQGENKVAWCNIIRATDYPGVVPADLGGDYGSDAELYVMRVTYQKSRDAFPVYYLPWAPNAAFRMKLKPSPNHPTQEGFFFKDTVEPAVFITAPLQGCSIIASGEAHEPVLYHLNAQAVQGLNGEMIGSPNDNDVQAAAQAKSDHMMARYNVARHEKAKEGPKTDGERPTQNYNSQAVHIRDYMDNALGTRLPLLRNHYLRGARGAVDQYGTVFGVRTGTNWEFFRQTRTRVCVYGATKRLDKSTWVDPVSVRFWP